MNKQSIYCENEKCSKKLYIFMDSDIPNKCFYCGTKLSKNLRYTVQCYLEELKEQQQESNNNVLKDDVVDEQTSSNNVITYKNLFCDEQSEEKKVVNVTKEVQTQQQQGVKRKYEDEEDEEKAKDSSDHEDVINNPVSFYFINQCPDMENPKEEIKLVDDLLPSNVELKRLETYHIQNTTFSSFFRLFLSDNCEHNIHDYSRQTGSIDSTITKWKVNDKSIFTPTSDNWNLEGDEIWLTRKHTCSKKLPTEMPQAFKFLCSTQSIDILMPMRLKKICDGCFIFHQRVEFNIRFDICKLHQIEIYKQIDNRLEIEIKFGIEWGAMSSMLSLMPVKHLSMENMTKFATIEAKKQMKKNFNMILRVCADNNESNKKRKLNH